MEYEVETSVVAAEIGMGMSAVGIEVDGYWVGGVNEQEIWATEEEYDQASQGYRLSDGGGWNGGMDYKVGGFEGRQSRSGSEPSHKKSKNMHGDYQGNGSRGRSGYQGEFVQGTSSGTPPPSNGTAEERSSSGEVREREPARCSSRLSFAANSGQAPALTVPIAILLMGWKSSESPPNWQEIVAAQEDHTPRSEIRGENQIPCVSSSAAAGDSQRFHKTRHCKKFYTEAGCPYGDSCNFVHDDQSRSRESVAISLGPTTSTGSGNGAGNGNNGNGPFQRPLNWKTRICNKWETTGHCPFGEKCHFAHGLAELQKFGGGIADADNGDASVGPRNDLKQTGTLTKAQMEAGSGQATSVYNTDNFVMGTSNQRAVGSFLAQKQGQKILPKWKGPDKISKIYGDWIEDNEWEYITRPMASQIEKVNQTEEEMTNEV